LQKPKSGRQLDGILNWPSSIERSRGRSLSTIPRKPHYEPSGQNDAAFNGVIHADHISPICAKTFVTVQMKTTIKATM
jgi:hypothetical protein